MGRKRFDVLILNIFLFTNILFEEIFAIQSPMKKLATMVVLRHQNAFLLLKRKKQPNAGMFVPVGGKLEAHESPRQAALRECFEETGIQLAEVKFCGVLAETSPVEYNWLCYIYLADIEHVPPPDCDEGELHWIDFEKILTVPTPPTDFQIYKMILESRHFVLDAIFDADLRLLAMSDEITGERFI